MIRSMMLTCLAVALTASAAACDKAYDDQKKADTAQAEANDKISTARKEADDKVNNAQAEADKKIAAAQADFMRLREDYRHTVSEKLVDLDKRVADLEAKDKTATGTAKAALDANLKQIHASRDAFAADYKSLDAASAVTWDDTKQRLDKEWNDLSALVAKA